MPALIFFQRKGLQGSAREISAIRGIQPGGNVVRNFNGHSLNNSVVCGDPETTLSGMNSNSIDAVVTSPPYYGQRDYSHPGQ